MPPCGKTVLSQANRVASPARYMYLWAVAGHTHYVRLKTLLVVIYAARKVPPFCGYRTHPLRAAEGSSLEPSVLPQLQT